MYVVARRNRMLIDEIQRILDAASEGDTDQCLDIILPDSPDAWAQITWDTINAYYPYFDEPENHLTKDIRLPNGSEVIEWKPGEFVTVECGVDDARAIEEFVIRYLSMVTDNQGRTLRLVASVQEL
jgi:hypothetical protein